MLGPPTPCTGFFTLEKDGSINESTNAKGKKDTRNRHLPRLLAHSTYQNQFLCALLEPASTSRTQKSDPSKLHWRSHHIQQAFHLESWALPTLRLLVKVAWRIKQNQPSWSCVPLCITNMVHYASVHRRFGVHDSNISPRQGQATPCAMDLEASTTPSPILGCSRKLWSIRTNNSGGYVSESYHKMDLTLLYFTHKLK